MEFKKNVGEADKVVRVIIGLAALGAYFSNMLMAPLSYVLVLIAIVMFFTAATSSCWLYTALGLSTCAAEKKK
ncbi:MAG: DUF2892 domain-containing protein [Candidatus Micrarchaeia archaeon]